MRQQHPAGKADSKTTTNRDGRGESHTRLADEGLAQGTRKTYRRAVRRFDDWLAGRPETDAELAAHLDRMFAQGLSPKYAGVVVAAVAERASREGRSSPAGELTARSLAGFRRNGAGRGTGQVAGVGWKDAKRMAKRARARGGLAGLRDALYIRIASACLLRVSEASALDVGDLSFADDGGLLVHIRRSKTDQEGEGSTHYAGKPAAVLARRWLKASGIDGGPLFRRIHRSGNVGGDRLGERRLRDVAKRWAADAGIDDRVSGHSFRIGAAQSMRDAGATHAEIMVEGRWKRVETMLRYIREQDAAAGPTARLCFGVVPPDGRGRPRFRKGPERVGRAGRKAAKAARSASGCGRTPGASGWEWKGSKKGLHRSKRRCRFHKSGFAEPIANRCSPWTFWHGSGSGPRTPQRIARVAAVVGPRVDVAGCHGRRRAARPA